MVPKPGGGERRHRRYQRRRLVRQQIVVVAIMVIALIITVLVLGQQWLQGAGSTPSTLGPFPSSPTRAFTHAQEAS
jgi:hypothetical protein